MTCVMDQFLRFACSDAASLGGLAQDPPKAAMEDWPGLWASHGRMEEGQASLLSCMAAGRTRLTRAAAPTASVPGAALLHTASLQSSPGGARE